MTTDTKPAQDGAPSIVEAAHQFTEAMIPKADASAPYPLWHGWALREAFITGAETLRSAFLDKQKEVDQARTTRRAFQELAKKKHKKDAETIAALRKERDALAWWQSEHERILSVSNSFFIKARASVAHLLDDAETGQEGICRNMLRIAKERDEARSYKDRLPANWFEDASLETWFPLTAETLEKQTKELDALRESARALREALKQVAEYDDRPI